MMHSGPWPPGEPAAGPDVQSGTSLEVFIPAMKRFDDESVLLLKTVSVFTVCWK